MVEDRHRLHENSYRLYEAFRKCKSLWEVPYLDTVLTKFDDVLRFNKGQVCWLHICVVLRVVAPVQAVVLLWPMFCHDTQAYMGV